MIPIAAVISQPLQKAALESVPANAALAMDLISVRLREALPQDAADVAMKSIELVIAETTERITTAAFAAAVKYAQDITDRAVQSAFRDVAGQALAQS